MAALKPRRVCIVPAFSDGTGGPNSFYRNIEIGLKSRGIDVARSFDDEPYDAILVINGTRHLARLWWCKKKGIRIVQRLGGINWLHRHLAVGSRGYLLAEIRNLNMRLIRSCITDHIVFQSHFVKDWWERKYGLAEVASTVIYNGVDLTQFKSQGPTYQSTSDVCIISVEGTQGADPFDIAVKLAQALQKKGLISELLMFGNPWKNVQNPFVGYPFVNFRGRVPNSALPYFYRGARFYVSTDVISACPNSVIEALACGAPVLGYKAGVLPELLTDSAGLHVESYGDPMKGEMPGNLDAMVSAALELLESWDKFHHGARSLAEARYGLDRMVDAYVEVLRAGL